MSDTQPILCGECNVTPERGFERDGEMWASVPSAGAKTVLQISKGRQPNITLTRLPVRSSPVSGAVA